MEPHCLLPDVHFPYTDYQTSFQIAYYSKPKPALIIWVSIKDIFTHWLISYYRSCCTLYTTLPYTLSDLIADCLRGRLSSYPFDFHHCSCCQGHHQCQNQMVTLTAYLSSVTRHSLVVNPSRFFPWFFKTAAVIFSWNGCFRTGPNWSASVSLHLRSRKPESYYPTSGWRLKNPHKLNKSSPAADKLTTTCANHTYC